MLHYLQSKFALFIITCLLAIVWVTPSVQASSQLVPEPIKVNFQTFRTATPEGYLADTGAKFGNRGDGYRYGWNINHGTEARDRDLGAHSPDERYDTFNHMQLAGIDYSWEIEVDNGWYHVYVVSGDPEHRNGTYRLDVEGVLTVDGTPNAGQYWVDGSQLVEVTDGRLTVSNNAAATGNNKLSFIEITHLNGIPSGLQAQVNFQPATADSVPGYLVDGGEIFAARDNGLSYGWDTDITSKARDRNQSAALDQRCDTLNQMQHQGSYTWEMTVPNGRYLVYIQAGDPQYHEEHRYAFNVEGTTTMNGDSQPANRLHSFGMYSIVEVTDGQLTIANDDLSSRNKIQFLHIYQIN